MSSRKSSQLRDTNGFRFHHAARLRPECALHHEVDGRSQKLFEVPLERHVPVEPRGFSECHENVDVTLLSRFATSDGSEDSEGLHAEAAGKLAAMTDQLSDNFLTPHTLLATSGSTIGAPRVVIVFRF